MKSEFPPFNADLADMLRAFIEYLRRSDYNDRW